MFLLLPFSYKFSLISYVTIFSFALRSSVLVSGVHLPLFVRELAFIDLNFWIEIDAFGVLFLANCLFVCDFLRSSSIPFRGIVSTWRICTRNAQWSKVVLKVNVLIENSFLFVLMTITDWFLVSFFVKLYFFIISR